MIFFVTVLRALAAMIITNSHYVGIYPTDLIANGGLLGDVIFFAVSGFCLCNVKQGFPTWYAKRVTRIYPQVILITLLYLFVGIISVDSKGWLYFLVYPTNYHFVASIILLYIPFYFIMKLDKLKQNVHFVFLGVLLAQVLVYIFLVDKTSYNIDTVRAPFIRFIFAEAMLLGAYFRINLDRFKDKNRLINWLLLVFFAGVYFVSKIAFSKWQSISRFQLANQAALLVLLYFVFCCFAGIDSRLERLPKPVKKIIEFISEITLEIYLVQIGIIPFFAERFRFPVNWVLLTATIIAGAFVLHGAAKLITSGAEKLSGKIIKKEKKTEE